MATVIKIKNSSVTGKAPAAGDLARSELALNLADHKLYSKDASDTVFEIGRGGEVPSGGTPPASGNNVGDLFYDTTNEILVYWDGSEWVEVGAGSEVIVSPTPPITTDLEEGTLWWNSDAGDMQLYVLYNDADPDGGLKWIEASPVPSTVEVEGYPDVEDGKGATLDDRYVSKTVADHKVGALTIGPDTGTSNITFETEAVVSSPRSSRHVKTVTLPSHLQ